MLPKKIMLIINPVSGKMKAKTGLIDVLDELYRLPPTGDATVGEPARERRVTVCPTMRRGHATSLAADAADEGFDTVICCGGDGTLNETVSGLLTVPPERRPILGYIPAGTTNDFAASMGLPGHLRAAARVAVGESDTRLDVGTFSSVGHVETKRYFSYIASFGAFTASSYSTPQTTKNVIGHAAYVIEGIKDLGSIQPRHAAIDLPDGRRLEGDYVFGAVTNTTSAGGVVRLPADAVSMSDGLLEIVLIRHPRNPAELNKILASLVSATLDGNPLIEFVHTPSARFTLSEPLRWSLDGEEAGGGTRVDITCMHGAVRLKRG